MGTVEYQHGSYTVSDDQTRLELNAIGGFWNAADSTKSISMHGLERAMANSLCIGAYASVGNQVGLIRLITDFASFCFLCDLFVHVDHRHQGLSKVMIAAALNHPRLGDVPRWNAITADAQELFTRAGFSPIASPECFMERLACANQIERPVSKAKDEESCLGYN